MVRLMPQATKVTNTQLINLQVIYICPVLSFDLSAISLKLKLSYDLKTLCPVYYCTETIHFILLSHDITPLLFVL